jgi:hypothetical protein
MDREKRLARALGLACGRALLAVAMAAPAYAE